MAAEDVYFNIMRDGASCNLPVASLNSMRQEKVLVLRVPV